MKVFIATIFSFILAVIAAPPHYKRAIPDTPGTYFRCRDNITFKVNDDATGTACGKIYTSRVVSYQNKACCIANASASKPGEFGQQCAAFNKSLGLTSGAYCAV